MIVVDSSAFVAILLEEPEATLFSGVLSRADRRAMSAATYLECAMVAAKRTSGRDELDAWLERRRIEVHPVDAALARIAADAFVRYGKGRHPAGLNYGDCFSYALATMLGAPLLFKGDDFARTDIGRAEL